MNTKTNSAAVRLVKTPLSEQAYDELKRQILDQQLKPGERLNIDALSRSCGISSSPLREALTRLGAEGLVVFAANTGFSVAPVPDARQMGQLMDFRLLMEAHCARVGAAAAGHAQTAVELEKAIAAMVALRRKGASYKQYRAFIDLEQSFHQSIVDSAGNEPISAAWRELHLIMNVARLSVLPESNVLGSDAAVQEHRQIAAAFAARDPAGAELALRRHLQAARDRMQPGVQS
ncbi:GntR family transcriptional regulator [Xylophilus sp.]|uniref:GntR family transcriptional regulator n=1 Tax=Xylophilus sp. TaxID=2653893 RepID=UPI0013B6118B|nr:GntR family transcriptional regulator [Xylophilus sp.]KAF1047313.1 MAG: HTH-type transcriptional repressor RspR [Xylophilus sp.]